MQKIIVVDRPKDWNIDLGGVEVVSAREYLTDQRFAVLNNVRVFNLCNDYTYQTKGYYVSLLAEARHHKSLPTVKNMIDLRTPKLVRMVSDNIYDEMQSCLRRIKTGRYELLVYFGQCMTKVHANLSAELHRHFPVPFLRARFEHNGREWYVRSLRAIPVKEIPPEHIDFAHEAARQYFSRKRYHHPRADKTRYDLAILVNPKDPSPPSDKKAIKRMMGVAEKMGFYVDLVYPEEFEKVAEYDALFIRETTSVIKLCYRFARKAQAEGLAVIDDPEAILRCSNKVYLAELLAQHNIRTPKTMIVHQDNKNQVVEKLGLPVVFKLPDSRFSLGVSKATTEEEAKSTIAQLLEQSDLAIAQEYLYTDFDWRVGVLDGEALYACRYYMARGHWQVYNWRSEKKAEQSGHYECMAVEDAPPAVIRTAVKAASLIGDGLFGVDLKEVGGKVVVIEVNDNPNLDYGVEDKVLGDRLYEKIFLALKKRIEANA